MSRWVLVVAVVLGTWLRFHDLGGPSLWMDEGFTYVIARAPLAEVPAKTVELERSPPGYFILMHLVTEISQSEWAMRFPSALSGVLTILVVFWLGRCAFGEREGALAALLLAVSPLHVLMSHDARNYAVGAFFLTLSTALWMLELKTPGRGGTLAAYVLSAAAAVYSHYICFAALGLQWLCGLAYGGRRTYPRRLAAVIGVMALFGPTLSVMLHHSARGTPGHAPAGWFSFVDMFFVQIAGFFLNMRTLWVVYFLAVLGAALVIGALVLGRTMGDVLVFTVCAGTSCALVVISMSMGLAIFEAKYLVLVSPLFCLLAARTVRLVGSGPAPPDAPPARGEDIRFPKAAWALGLLLLCIGTTSTCNLLAFEEWQKQDWRSAVALVKRLGRPDDAVLVEPDWGMPVFSYYAVRMGLDGHLLPIGTETATTLQPEALRPFPRVWLFQAESGMVDPALRVPSMLEHTRPRLLTWAAARRSPSFVVSVTLYGPPR